MCVEDKAVPVSRNYWIVEALIEKIAQIKNGTWADGA